jgi:hypothetical protein
MLEGRVLGHDGPLVMEAMPERRIRWRRRRLVVAPLERDHITAAREGTLAEVVEGDVLGIGLRGYPIIRGEDACNRERPSQRSAATRGAIARIIAFWDGD